ncbi:MAG: hypothetical protein V8Q79_11385, partial [Christensenellales bacterium]
MPLWVLAIILFKEVMMVIGGGVALKHGIVVDALPIGKITDGDVCAFHGGEIYVRFAAGGYPVVDIGCAVDGRAGLVCNRFDEKTGTQADLNNKMLTYGGS